MLISEILFFMTFNSSMQIIQIIIAKMRWDPNKNIFWKSNIYPVDDVLSYIQWMLWYMWEFNYLTQVLLCLLISNWGVGLPESTMFFPDGLMNQSFLSITFLLHHLNLAFGSYLCYHLLALYSPEKLNYIALKVSLKKHLKSWSSLYKVVISSQ